MTFLEIVRKANQFAGLQGQVDSVLSVAGLQSTLVEAVKAAYIDIQLISDTWSWRYKSGSLPWGTASTSYSDSTVDHYTKLYYNEKDLKFVEYDTWILSPPTVTSFPESFTIVPETGAVIINPADANYVVSFRAYKSVDTLTSNIQVPIIPLDYQLIIAYKAAADMAGGVLGNFDVANKNTEKYDILLGQLKRRSALPKRVIMRPLA